MTDTDPTPQATYTVRIDRDQLDRLHEIAATEHRTLAQMFRVMIESKIALDDHRISMDAHADSPPEGR